MHLQTKIPIAKQSENLLDYQAQVLLLGSCFVENIGKKLEYYKFQNLKNPFGVLFQPTAIERLLVRAEKKEMFTESDVFYHNERWHCFDAHSKLSATNQSELLTSLNRQLELTREGIQSASHIVITLGTAWVYRFLNSNTLVANCHKVPQKQFKKELLPVEAIITSLNSLSEAIRAINSEATLIFTVSPVRHLKDGFVENTLSKSHLITAVHKFIKRDTDNRSEVYFPSYEIMMDELRDYRFYADDMVHPNSLAVNYIWERFTASWCSTETLKTMEAVADIQKALQHKPFNPDSLAHKKFLLKTESKIKQVQAQFPCIKF
ncbi:GSCFA domain-containing protein [Gaetbulibacter saemankumensis]|uniref:GSCFA domain-containing protein n=1 Tax=Gaetbulibacter saemankumensis TaxID=311208 RepID=UPI0003FBC9AE|nr:GSCFA domain-containing protein [Gaetbulibacter saemankumensis]